MKSKRLALILSVIMAMTTIVPFKASGSVYNGWENENGYWYYYTNGNMMTGWQKDGTTWYYLNQDGSMKTGWLNDNGTWYFLNADGSMAHDTEIEGYKFNSNGVWIQESYSANKNNNINKSGSFIDNLNRFSTKSASTILNKQEKNTNSNYSPISLYMALTVLSEGTDNDTRSQLYKALNVTNPESLSSDCQKLYNDLTLKNKNSMCSLADSIWINDYNKNYEINQDTLDKIQDKYKAGLFKRNLLDFDTSKEISSWISAHTNGKLGNNPNNFKFTDPQIAMVIFNTIYFKDVWTHKFYSEDTIKGNFRLNDNSTVETDFMKNSLNGRIYTSSDYKVSSLPFRSGYDMKFILPSEDKSPYDILNDDTLYNALNCLDDEKSEYGEINYSIPKFNYNTSLDLNKCAEDLGLNCVYDSSADFSKFSNEAKLNVSDIKQESNVSLNENGAEAAAYTEVLMTETACMTQTKKFDMKLDKPFIFAITNKDNIPLFIGIVNNPESKN